MVLPIMIAQEIDLSIEVDFLEWLIHAQSKPIKIDKMPLSVFEGLVEKYLIFLRLSARL